MTRHTHNRWLLLSPSLPELGPARVVFREFAERLAGLLAVEADGQAIQRAALQATRLANEIEQPTLLRAALLILTDLARQRWSIRVTHQGAVEVKHPNGMSMTPLLEKARVRSQEEVKRDEQLSEPATRKFIKSMETSFVHKGKRVSVFSLMRDGRELAAALRQARLAADGEAQRMLGQVIQPYLQFVDVASKCEQTGMRLQDVWRYFRHTWANQYTSTPGRTMAFLIRDRAKEFHPVIGIGAIGSPIVQIQERDTWIGWDPEAFIELASEEPSAGLATWLVKTVDTAIEEIFVEDFLEEQLVSLSELRAPTDDLVARLTKYGDAQRELHHRLTGPQEFKRSPKRSDGGTSGAHWRDRACSHLYKSKRALTLASMLRSRSVLRRFISDTPTAEEVRALVGHSEGRRTLKAVLRKAKSERVGIAMADITVCGAIAPYGPILGGKLVSMLSASPEVVMAYRRKYAEQESEIASSMAGRPIVRSSELVFLGTTSLYGVGSSQYNRIKIPAEELGGHPGEFLQFFELGKSESYGTSHFSADTVAALVSLVQQSSNGKRVNSIFGEGVSPKLRKIRNGLDFINFPSDALLQHGRNRIVYGVPVIRNLREFLLGMDSNPEYIFDIDKPGLWTLAICKWWISRWLSKRVMQDEVLSKVEEHTLVRPIRHGARVVLPAVDEEQGSFFDDAVS